MFSWLHSDPVACSIVINRPWLGQLSKLLKRFLLGACRKQLA